MNNNNKTSEFDELQENLNRIDLLTKRLVLLLLFIFCFPISKLYNRILINC